MLISSINTKKTLWKGSIVTNATIGSGNNIFYNIPSRIMMSMRYTRLDTLMKILR